MGISHLLFEEEMPQGNAMQTIKFHWPKIKSGNDIFKQKLAQIFMGT